MTAIQDKVAEGHLQRGQDERPIEKSFDCVFVRVFMCLFVCVFVCLFVCLFVCVFGGVFVC